MTAQWAGLPQHARRKSCSCVTQSSLCLRVRSAPLILRSLAGLYLVEVGGGWLCFLVVGILGPPCVCCVVCEACCVFAHVFVVLWSCVMGALFVWCTLCVLMWSSVFLLSGLVLCSCSFSSCSVFFVACCCFRASCSSFGHRLLEVTCMFLLL